MKMAYRLNTFFCKKKTTKNTSKLLCEFYKSEVEANKQT